MMLESLLLVHGHDERDLRHLKLTFDLVVELLPVAIELHDALWLLFQPELIKLIRQVTCQHDIERVTHMRPCYTNESHDTGERKWLIGPNLDIFT